VSGSPQVPGVRLGLPLAGLAQTPGAWAGSVVHTADGDVSTMVEQTKWVKAKAKLRWVSDRLESGPDVEYKPLESIRGFLVYVAHAYPPMIPYLRGFHGTLDSWRPNRTKDGFDGRLNAELSVLRVERLGPKRRKVIGSREEADEYDPSSQLNPKFGIDVEDVEAIQVFPSAEKFIGTGSSSAQQPPLRVTFTSRMDDLEALFQMTRDVSPHHNRRVRSLRVVRATYGFGDARCDSSPRRKNLLPTRRLELTHFQRALVKLSRASEFGRES